MGPNGVQILEMHLWAIHVQASGVRAHAQDRLAKAPAPWPTKRGFSCETDVAIPGAGRDSETVVRNADGAHSRLHFWQPELQVAGIERAGDRRPGV